MPKYRVTMGDGFCKVFEAPTPEAAAIAGVKATEELLNRVKSYAYLSENAKTVIKVEEVTEVPRVIEKVEPPRQGYWRPDDELYCNGFIWH